MVGLQLTHSGRWSRPLGEPLPRVAYRHPLLDDRVGVTDAEVLSDGELDELVGAFVGAARVAAEAGFDFVDVKQCHGYLAHELLSGVDRPGRYGGDLDGRTRFVRSVIEGITADVPGLGVASRISVYDLAPHGPDDLGVGHPLVGDDEPYRYAFGGDGTVAGIDATEVDVLVDALAALGVGMVCVTAGSPYYTPHAQRPAYFPPSDGYLPPHDPLIDVATMVDATRTAGPGPSRCRRGRVGSELPAGVAARRGPGAGARRVDGGGRLRAHGAELPDPAGRRGRRAAPRPRLAVPHVQRLHDGAPARAGVGLLPARRRLQAEPAAGGAHRR